MASATAKRKKEEIKNSNKTHLVNVWKRKISSTAAAEIKFIGK